MVRPPIRARSSAAEHLTFNQRVDGSIPSGLTNLQTGCKVSLKGDASPHDSRAEDAVMTAFGPVNDLMLEPVQGPSPIRPVWPSPDDLQPLSAVQDVAGAVSKTAAGREIDVLDPGGFGAVTITNSLTIDGGAGQVASVLASAGSPSIIAGKVGNSMTIPVGGTVLSFGTKRIYGNGTNPAPNSLQGAAIGAMNAVCRAGRRGRTGRLPRHSGLEAVLRSQSTTVGSRSGLEGAKNAPSVAVRPHLKPRFG